MKILIASDLHWPTINGVATFSRNLAQGLAARGHEVLVIAPSQIGKRYNEQDGDYEIRRTASVPFPFYQNFRISITPQKEVKKIINDFGPDIIHIQMLMWIGQAAMRYGNKYGVPIVSTNHAMPENLMDNMRLLAPVARPISYMLKEYGARFHSKADFVTMPTQSAIDLFSTSDRMSVPLEAVSNGIDLSRFKPTKAPSAIYEKFDLPKNKKIVGYVGRLDAEKHLNILVEAFNQLHDQQSHLLIVGDGTEIERLRNLSEILGISDRVTLTGRVSDEDLVSLHKVPDVFCMPSPAELQSIATLESMASGKPVVAVDAGALSELCQDERNGFLCEKDDIERIARSVDRLLSDDDMRQKFAAESLVIAKTHNLDETLDRFTKIYESLLA
ncbi:MAG: glycosyltransferase [bacterium]|nr:glycosyltransferase [bacterium]MDN5835567.1 glycosyltransferase [bacterium]